MTLARPTGFRGFTVVWFGQVISLLGTGMTRFAITIWAWQITGQATALALVSFFSFVPAIIVSPLAGALVDRWNRKLTMMLSDLGAVLSTTIVLLLFSTGNLQIWHLYITGAFTGFFHAFQFPAYSAAITTMVSQKQYGRASGMRSMAQFGTQIFAPMLAAISLNLIGLQGILVIDLATFLIAIGTLILIHIPRPSVSEEGRRSKGSLWTESVYGFRYIIQRRSLLGLQLVFFSLNLVVSFATTVFTPMVMARTGNNTTILGIIQSTLGVGGLVGGVVLSIWGGPKRKIHGVLTGMILTMVGMVGFGVGDHPYAWAAAGFFAMFFVPILNGSNQAIWQIKVAPDLQGRVFATRSLISQISAPVSILLSGPLADYVFEPAMMPGGQLTSVLGGLIGTGPGAGMKSMFFIAGILGILVGLSGYLFPIVRNIEDILPDYKAET
ncbi:MAG: MFS transporter [Candidatus Bathyarchaeota archaeon]|nr:MFS transporter [Candidatus Bathyarchaeota archaeon]